MSYFCRNVKMRKSLKKVLIIDDDEISNFITKSILDQSNKIKNVDAAMSADEGLALLKSSKSLPELILLDIKMPLKSGWDFLDELVVDSSIDNSEITIVMLSSSVYPYDVHKSKDYKEVSGYLSKPITLKKVDKIFEDYL